jgi:serine/threonine-protein kinase
MKRVLPARLLAALRPAPEAAYELPSDLLRDSRGRVRIAAALGTAAFALFLAVDASGVLGGSALERRIDITHDLLSLLVCGALLLVASFSNFADRAVLGMALAVEVLLSALISIADPWATFDRTGSVPGITWVIPVIILFPLLVPARPRTTLLVSSLCALTMPAGLAALAATGRIAARPSDFWAAWVGGAVAVGIASVAARTVYGAGGQAAAARMVGSYELLDLIGRGGAGEVWKGRHLLLARRAAVKLMLPEHLQGAREARDAALARFSHEAQVTASLTSPHTVALYDFGVSAETSLYYVMELLEGTNLQHFVYRYGAIEPRRAVHWLRQACHSLGEAHARGLIHRDIKPSNLFLCRYGRDQDFLKVLDFGLSKPTAGDALDMTRATLRLGTPGYMAPEQIFGQAVSPATDLYALGCVAYWLLAGVTPFDSDDAGELLRMHAQSAPPPLAGRAKQPIPEALEATVMACLAKDPAARPADADRLDARLAAIDDGAAWTPADAHAWWEQHAGDP